LNLYLLYCCKFWHNCPAGVPSCDSIATEVHASTENTQSRPTEHSFESDRTQDKVVEVDLAALVAVPHHETLERRVTHQET